MSSGFYKYKIKIIIKILEDANFVTKKVFKLKF